MSDRRWGTGRGRAVATAFDQRPLLLITLGMVLYSLGPILIAGSSASGAVLSFWRLWMGAALMGALTLWRRRVSGVRASRRGWAWTAAAGLAFGVHQLFFMMAVKATSVVDVTLMQVLQPIFVGVLALMLFGERPGLAFRLWSCLAVAGAAVVVLAGTTGPDGDPVGMTLAVLNVVFASLYFVASKRAITHISALPFLFGVAVVAATGVTVYTLVAQEPIGAASGRDLAIAALIAAVPGGLGHFLSTHPLRRVAANIPPVIQLAIPFIAGGLAWLLLGQPITWMHVIGGAITLFGVVGALLSSGGRRLKGSDAPDDDDDGVAPPHDDAPAARAGGTDARARVIRASTRR